MSNIYSSGSTTATTFVREASFGVTPATPTMQTIPVKNNTITLTQDNLSSDAVSGDRMRRFTRRGNTSVAGNLDIELAHETFDELLEGLLMDRWTGDVIKVSNTASSFSIERGDKTKNIYELFTGCVIDSATFSVSLGSLVETGFTFIGKGGVDSATSVDSDPTPAPDKQPMYQADCAVKIDGQKVDYVQDISLTISNNAVANNSIGFDSASAISTNMVTVTGTATFYLKDLVAKNWFTNETSTSMELVLDDGKGNTLTILMPEIDWQTANMAQSGSDTRTLTMDFEAVYDSGINSVLQLTRS